MAKTKALISFAVTAKLICVFVFAYADCWFSHGAAHISMLDIVKLCFMYMYMEVLDKDFGPSCEKTFHYFLPAGNT